MDLYLCVKVNPAYPFSMSLFWKDHKRISFEWQRRSCFDGLSNLILCIRLNQICSNFPHNFDFKGCVLLDFEDCNQNSRAKFKNLFQQYILFAAQYLKLFSSKWIGTRNFQLKITTKPCIVYFMPTAWFLRYGIDTIKEGHRVAYLYNVKTATIVDEDLIERTALSLYLIEPNGNMIHAYLKFPPYFYVTCNEDLIKYWRIWQ